MDKLKFRLTGAPPDQAMRVIAIDPKDSILEVKREIQREYQLNPILHIEIIHNGKVLPDSDKIKDYNVSPPHDEFTIMARQAGGK